MASGALPLILWLFCVASGAHAEAPGFGKAVFYRYLMSTRPMPTEMGGRDRKSRFLIFSADAPQGFVLPVGFRPERICDRMDEGGFANGGWRQAELATSGWECVSVSAGSAEQTDAQVNSLFTSLRGKTRLRISSARLKISVPQAATATQTSTRAAEFLELLGKSIGVETPAAVRDATRNLNAIHYATEYANYSLRPESGGESRHNLMIEYGRPINVLVHISHPPRLEARKNAASGVETARSGKSDRVRRSE